MGYKAGSDPAPTYDSVCSGRTGHTEAVQCTYDPKEVSYAQLLDTFFARVDPTTLNRQVRQGAGQWCTLTSSPPLQHGSIHVAVRHCEALGGFMAELGRPRVQKACLITFLQLVTFGAGCRPFPLFCGPHV